MSTNDVVEARLAIERLMYTYCDRLDADADVVRTYIGDGVAREVGA